VTMELVEVDTRTAPEDLLVEMYHFYVPLFAEELPEDPPTPMERRIKDWRYGLETEATPRWILRDGSGIVGAGVVFYDLEQDLKNGYMRVNIRADRRREGLGRRLAKPMLDRLESVDRIRVSTHVKEGWSIEDYLTRVGLKSSYRERRSRLVVTDVDREEMTLWIDRSAERASEYELISMQAPYPESFIEKWCTLQFLMNTAPMEDLVREDHVWTPTTWRDLEKTVSASEKDIDTLVAVHRPTGDWVGSTSIQTDRLDPAQAWQWETVVDPEHRNKGLGRWLKGSMLLSILNTHPRIVRIDTWNAGSNEPMLNINLAMGFKPILITNEYQGEIKEVRFKAGV